MRESRIGLGKEGRNGRVTVPDEAYQRREIMKRAALPSNWLFGWLSGMDLIVDREFLKALRVSGGHCGEGATPIPVCIGHARSLRTRPVENEDQMPGDEVHPKARVVQSPA